MAHRPNLAHHLVLHNPRAKNRLHSFKCKCEKRPCSPLADSCSVLLSGSHSLKYLLSGPFQKKFADPWPKLTGLFQTEEMRSVGKKKKKKSNPPLTPADLLLHFFSPRSLCQLYPQQVTPLPWVLPSARHWSNQPPSVATLKLINVCTMLFIRNKWFILASKF